MSSISEILTRSPVNGNAYRVTSQRGCATVETDIGKGEIIELADRLIRKMRLMKTVLGITSKVQHKNFTKRFNKGRLNIRQGQTQRLIDEYIRVGLSIHNLNNEMAVCNAAKKFVHMERKKWEERA